MLQCYLLRTSPCPCLFTCTFCNETHSCHVELVIALDSGDLDDMFNFKRLLQDNLSNVWMIPSLQDRVQ